ncbi:MAG: alpha/beta hydrolase [Bacteroidia bacterium]
MLYNLSAREDGGGLFLFGFILLLIPKFGTRWKLYTLSQVLTFLAVVLLWLPVYRIYGFNSGFNYVEWIKSTSPNASTDELQVVAYRDVKALYYKVEPESLKPSPSCFFILLHGGGFTSGNASHMNTIGSFLASNGIPAFSLDYSLAPKRTFPIQVQEIDSLLKVIRKNDLFSNFSSKPFILLGASAGGTIALNYAHLKPDPALKMVLNLYGITDTGFIYPESSRSQANLQEMADAYRGGVSIDAISPLRNASRIHVPIITFMGNSDAIVPIEQAVFFHEKRHKMKFYNDRLFILPGATHLFDHPLTGPSGQFLKKNILDLVN